MKSYCVVNCEAVEQQNITDGPPFHIHLVQVLQYIEVSIKMKCIFNVLRSLCALTNYIGVLIKKYRQKNIFIHV